MKKLTSILFLVFATVNLVYAQTTIQMEKEGGVYYVPCSVNGLKLRFIFDTGASDVSISLSEALFMIKNGYMSEDDVVGTERYRIANGEIEEGTKILIRKLVIGGRQLTNVRASIVHSMKAPLLLGQSVLERFGNVSINYANSTLILGGSGSSLQTTERAANSNVQNINKTELHFGSVRDVDGNSYKTIVIGNQTWMAENLISKHYSTGDLIPEVPINLEWRNSITGAWANYNNDSYYEDPYGKLYNWKAVTDYRNVCPIGWHVPSKEEFDALVKFLGGRPIAGGKLKRVGNELWRHMNGEATNSSGFSGFPAGLRGKTGTFLDLDSEASWWSKTTTPDKVGWAYALKLSQYDGNAYMGKFGYEVGLPVRCIKD